MHRILHKSLPLATLAVSYWWLYHDGYIQVYLTGSAISGGFEYPCTLGFKETSMSTMVQLVTTVKTT